MNFIQTECQWFLIWRPSDRFCLRYQSNFIREESTLEQNRTQRERERGREGGRERPTENWGYNSAQSSGAKSIWREECDWVWLTVLCQINKSIFSPVSMVYNQGPQKCPQIIHLSLTEKLLSFSIKATYFFCVWELGESYLYRYGHISHLHYYSFPSDLTGFCWRKSPG